MHSRRWINTLIAMNVLVVIVFTICYASASYPVVGHDYRLFLPRLLDTYLHYKINGLTIQWYTPSFGGGLPAFANPLQMQYSLTQLLTWFVNPWIAVMASAATYLAIGFLVTYLFLKNVLDIKPFSAILGACFFSANGFMIERLVVGHVNFISFPIVIVFAYALLHPKLPAWLAGSFISITSAVLVYTGGVYIGVIGFFTTLIILPISYFLRPALFSWRRILPVLVWAGVLSVLLCGSKLNATSAYMKNFPRTVTDQFSSSLIDGLKGIALQLIGPTNTLPILTLLHKSYYSYSLRLGMWTGTPYGYWELDSGLTPGLFFLLFIGMTVLVFRKHQVDKQKLLQKTIAALILAFGIVLVVSFATTKGVLYTQIRQLPFIKSLHANTRFTAAFILPLSILAAKAFESWTGRWKSKRTVFVTFLVINGISLGSLWAYYLMPLDIQNRNTNVSYMMIETWDRISAGETFPVKKIIPEMNDYEVIMLQASNVSHHYDPLFRGRSILLTPLVHEGSVFEVEDGYYNMTDPTSLVFPQSPSSTLFERIPVSDSQKMIDFVNRRQPDWKIPILQTILDWAAGVTFLLILISICVHLIRKWLLLRIRQTPTRFLRRLAGRR
jgi:hypothetical protein